MAERPSRRARKDLTIDVKLKLIADSEKIPKAMQKDLAEKYGIGKSSVCDILKRKAEFKQLYEENGNVEKKGVYSNAKFDTINKMTYKWFVCARSKTMIKS